MAHRLISVYLLPKRQKSDFSLHCTAPVFKTGAYFTPKNVSALFFLYPKSKTARRAVALSIKGFEQADTIHCIVLCPDDSCDCSCQKQIPIDVRSHLLKSA